MNWRNIKLLFARELRDQLRDRRTIFTIAVLPILLYPLLAMSMIQVVQFTKEHPTRIWMIGAERLEAASENAATSPLIEDNRFADPYCSGINSDLLELELGHQPNDVVLESIESLAYLEQQPLSEEAETEARAKIQKELEKSNFDAVVFVPQGFSEQFADRETQETPPIFLLTRSASDKSNIAGQRVQEVFQEFRRSLVKQKLEEKQISERDTQPFKVVSQDVSADTSRRAAMWSKILPFVMVIWALTGAFYPAIDLCAGEKERGTLETLLSSPAARAEIVFGKLLTVMVFSISTALLNLLSMGLTGVLFIRRLSSGGGFGGELPIGDPPIAAIGWLMLAIIPVAAIFSALSLAIAAFARSSKEGQYYLMPLLLITLPLMLVTMLPNAQLEMGTALIPVTGLMLWLRALIEGQYSEALRYAAPVIGVSATCCMLSVRWAVDQFKNESVLFRESERFGVGLWFRHLLRDRGDTPSFGEALLCGLLILLARFFAGMFAGIPDSWSTFTVSTVITQVAFFITPALLMALILTRKPLRSLQLTWPSAKTRGHRIGMWLTLPGAVVLAICFDPLKHWFAAAVVELYPLSPEMTQLSAELNKIVGQAPSMFAVLAVFALTPAICEEIAFRGFILRGLRSFGNKWMAVFVSAAIFGIAHGFLQQSITASVTGMILGFIAIQTRNIIPCMLFHLTHNSLSILVGSLQAEQIAKWPVLNWLFEPAGSESGVGAFSYSLIPGVVLMIIGFGLLLLLTRLKVGFNDEEPSSDYEFSSQTSNANMIMNP